MEAKDFKTAAYQSAMEDMHKAGVGNGKHKMSLCPMLMQLQTHEICGGGLSQNGLGVFAAESGWKSRKKGRGWHV